MSRKHARQIRGRALSDSMIVPPRHVTTKLMKVHALSSVHRVIHVRKQRQPASHNRPRTVNHVIGTRLSGHIIPRHTITQTKRARHRAVHVRVHRVRNNRRSMRRQHAATRIGRRVIPIRRRNLHAIHASHRLDRRGRTKHATGSERREHRSHINRRVLGRTKAV